MRIMVQDSFSRCIWLIIWVEGRQSDNSSKIQQLEDLVLRILHCHRFLDNLERLEEQWVRSLPTFQLQQHSTPIRESTDSQISFSILHAEVRHSVALHRRTQTRIGQHLGVRQGIPWRDGEYVHSSSRQVLLHQHRLL